MWVECFELYERIVCGKVQQYPLLVKVNMESDESSSKTRSETRSERSSEDNPATAASETESIFVDSSDSLRPKKYRSDVWDYFTKDTGRKKMLCRLCNNEYSYLGATSNLIRYHKDKYKRNDTVGSGNKQQTSMDTFLNRHKCTPARSKKIIELIAFMVTKDLRPAAVVDGEGFKRLLSFLEPGYVVPSSVHIMDVVGRKYAENTTKYSMTTDIWTSFANEAYISLTVHFIDDCWEMKSYTLATYSFPEQHTGDNIVEKLKEVVSEYQIDDNKIFAIVHDQGSNFQRAGRL